MHRSNSISIGFETAILSQISYRSDEADANLFCKHYSVLLLSHIKAQKNIIKHHNVLVHFIIKCSKAIL